MAIDPTISLQIKPPQLTSPMEHAMRALQMRAGQQQVQQGDMEIDATRRAQAEADAERALFARNPNATAADLAPIVGGQKAVEYDLGRSNALKAKLEEASTRSGLMAQFLQGVTDDRSLAMVKPAIAATFGPEAAAQLGDTYDAAHIKGLVSKGFSVKEWADNLLAGKEDARKQEAHDNAQPGVKADSTKKQTEALDAQAVTIGRLLGAATNTAEWKDALAQIDAVVPGAAKRYPSIFSKQHQQQAVRAALTAQQRIDNAQQDQQIAISRQNANTSSARLRLDTRDSNERRQARQALSQVVIDNPAMWDQLTPTEKGHIAVDLAQSGFTGFGKPLSESAITQLAQSRSAVDSLRDLRQTLKENEQYLGPVAGLAAMNPYSEARQAQAKIDLVRQRVGKALEGGVLRKEDEEKYKKILATLQDTPTLAINKIDGLISTIENDTVRFVDEQRRAGRRVVDPKDSSAQPSSSPNRRVRYDENGNVIKGGG